MELVDGYFTYKLSDKQFQLSDAEWKAIKATGVSEPRFWVHYDEHDAIFKLL